MAAIRRDDDHDLAAEAHIHLELVPGETNRSAAEEVEETTQAPSCFKDRKEYDGRPNSRSTCPLAYANVWHGIYLLEEVLYQLGCRWDHVAYGIVVLCWCVPCLGRKNVFDQQPQGYLSLC